MKYISFVVFLCISCMVMAACPMGEAARRAKHYAQAQSFFEGCALIDNDAEAQYTLAHMYMDGRIAATTPELMALRYLRLAAENGFAPAQYELANHMLDDLKTPNGQAVLSQHTDNMRQIKEQKGLPLTQMSPLAWMLLAGERAENKWFYTAPPVYIAAAEQYLQDAHLSPSHFQEIQEQAIQWKQNKLMHTARQVLTDEEWKKFVSESGVVEPAQRDAFVQTLKSKLKNYSLYK